MFRVALTSRDRSSALSMPAFGSASSRSDRRGGWALIFPVFAITVALVLSAISCATALAVGFEHDEHGGLAAENYPLDAALVVVNPSPGAGSNTDAGRHGGHEPERSVDDEHDRSGSPGAPSSGAPIVVIGDMVCGGPTDLRIAEPIVSQVVNLIMFDVDAIPAGCSVEPDPPVPKFS